MTDNIDQLHFEFKDWKECFKSWKDNIKFYGEENMQLIISTHSFTSGYWIEARGKELTDSDIIYVGKKVVDLENRFMKEIELAEKEKRGVNFIT